MLNQRNAVFAAIVAVLGREPERGEVIELEPNQRKAVHDILVPQFISGEIQFKGTQTPEYFKKYVPGLVNNWLRKDPRLNGDQQYKPKNPGIRTGSGDGQLQAMKVLLERTTDPGDRALIEQAIETRKAELKPKPKELNVAALPEHLRELAAKLTPQVH